jgi:hypothetical protein
VPGSGSGSGHESPGRSPQQPTRTAASSARRNRSTTSASAAPPAADSGDAADSWMEATAEPQGSGEATVGDQPRPPYASGAWRNAASVLKAAAAVVAIDHSVPSSMRGQAASAAIVMSPMPKRLQAHQRAAGGTHGDASAYLPPPQQQGPSGTPRGQLQAMMTPVRAAADRKRAMLVEALRKGGPIPDTPTEEEAAAGVLSPPHRVPPSAPAHAAASAAAVVTASSWSSPRRGMAQRQSKGAGTRAAGAADDAAEDVSLPVPSIDDVGCLIGRGSGGKIKRSGGGGGSSGSSRRHRPPPALTTGSTGSGLSAPHVIDELPPVVSSARLNHTPRGGAGGGKSVLTTLRPSPGPSAACTTATISSSTGRASKRAAAAASSTTLPRKHTASATTAAPDGDFTFVDAVDDSETAGHVASLAGSGAAAAAAHCGSKRGRGQVDGTVDAAASAVPAVGSSWSPDRSPSLPRKQAPSSAARGRRR